LNVGLLVGAALFADLLLWTLVLANVESVLHPHVAGSARYFSFSFPYSHGFVASLLWSAAAGVALWWMVAGGTPFRFRLGLVMALAVFSHFALDFIVHVPDLPIALEDSPKLGLGLWEHMPVALAVELALACAALVLFIRGSYRTPARNWLAIGIVVLTGALTVAGPYIPGPPPAPAAMAASSLVTLLVVVLLAFAVDGRVGVMSSRSHSA
jgi:hypothetical protein